MTEKKTHKLSTPGTRGENPSFLHEQPTQTIDMHSLFTKDVTTSGSFDLRGDIWGTSFGKLLQAVPIPSLLLDKSHAIVAANQAWRRISEDYEQILEGKFESILSTPSGMRSVVSVLENVFQTRNPDSTEAIIHVGDSKIWARLTFRSIRIVDVRHVLVLIEDLTAEKRQIVYQKEHTKRLKEEIDRREQVEAELIASQKRYRQVIENANDIIYQTDTKGIITFINQAGQRIIGYSEEEIIGKNHLTLVHPSYRNEAQKRRNNQIENKTPNVSDEFQFVTKQGRTIWVTENIQLLSESDEVIGFQAIARDVTERKLAEQTLRLSRDELEKRVKERTAELAKSNEELIREVKERRKAEKRLQHMAHYDPLTGLANRILFHDRLDRAIRRARRTQRKIGLMLLDLDRFKDVNDTLGHPLGDKLLQVVSKRLETCVRDSDTVGRLGGDEFIILIPDLQDTREVTIIANRILQSVTELFEIDGNEVSVTTSIGITFYPSDGQNVDRLLQNADTALYKAKSGGRNHYQFFSDEMNLELLERADLEAGLRVALEKDELQIFYQPMVHFDTGEIVSAELLLRWHRDGYGWVPTDKIIRIAEETGLIFSLGKWLLEKACRQILDWREMGIKPVRLSLNVSGFQLNRRGFVAQLIDTIDATGVDRALLQLELTESVAMSDLERTKDVFLRIHDYGVSIAVDDFGTGYSSLAYLKELPVNKLKIDKTFIQGIRTDERNKAIVSAIVAMAHSLGLEVIAEGIESREQLGQLWSLGCDEWQGYYFYKPLPLDKFTQLLRKTIKAESLSFRWTEDMSVHIPEIDRQHKEWCIKVENFSRSIWNGINQDQLSDFVVYLGDYARVHFGEEEAHMTKFEYPGYNDHIQKHDTMRDKVRKMNELAHGPLPTNEVLLEIIADLQEWFVDHISEIDKQLGDFLKDKL